MNGDTQLGKANRLSLDAVLEYIDRRGIEVKRKRDTIAMTIPPEHNTPETRRVLADHLDKLLEIAMRRRLFELRSRRPPRGPDHPGRWDAELASSLIETTLARIHDLFLSLPLANRAAALRALEGASLSIEQWVERRDLLGLSRILTNMEFRIARLAAQRQRPLLN